MAVTHGAPRNRPPAGQRPLLGHYLARQGDSQALDEGSISVSRSTMKPSSYPSCPVAVGGVEEFRVPCTCH